ncbi:hypothetical protein C8T65DRAFT_733894 [Cerioporus squamosus]|nr:hypothetical protein C8T65DRAFT_733894 [Cerioporus squamosus]
MLGDMGRKVALKLPAVQAAVPHRTRAAVADRTHRLGRLPPCDDFNRATHVSTTTHELYPAAPRTNVNLQDPDVRSPQLVVEAGDRFGVTSTSSFSSDWDPVGIIELLVRINHALGLCIDDRLHISVDDRLGIGIENGFDVGKRHRYPHIGLLHRLGILDELLECRPHLLVAIIDLRPPADDLERIDY